MSTLSWNCCGMGNLATIRNLKDLAQNKKPSFIFLSETKLNREDMEVFKRHLNYAGMFCVASRGKSGGIALLWKTSGMTKLLGFSSNHIDVEVAIEGQPRWRLTGLYGFPKWGRRRETWNLMRQLANKSDLPWLMIGDLNNLAPKLRRRVRYRTRIG